MPADIVGWESRIVFARKLEMGHKPIVDDIQNSAKGQEGVPCDVEVYRKPRTKAVSGYVRVELEEGDQVTYSFELGPWNCALLLTSVECITCSPHMLKTSHANNVLRAALVAVQPVILLQLVCPGPIF